MAEKNSLWKNIREKAKKNRASGATPKQPTTEMLRQERKIKSNQYAKGSFVGEEELPTYRYANKEGVIGGPRVTDKGTWLPTTPEGTLVVNMPEFEVISTGLNSQPNPYSPTSLNDFLNSDANPVNWFLPTGEQQRQPIDPKTGMPFPQSGLATPVYPETELIGVKKGKEAIDAFKHVDFGDMPIKKSKSEINWSNWNSEIPTNKPLIKEYNTIEKTSKANGTWMKNADGSKFQGTPEQFVQQNSNNFKKAFPNPVLDDAGNVQINYHGQRDGKPFNVFKPSQRGSHGVGNYTFPNNREAALRYANGDEKKLYELYINSNNPQQTVESVFSPEFNWTTGRIQPEYDYLRVGREQVTPEFNYLKSAIGNNGMFDMANPNIYKAVVPAAIGAGALQQSQQQATGGPTNTLEGDLISKVIMNRNRDKDFVKRAYAVGEYPESNMFVQPDANQFGEKNSHLMSWGEDESGQAYMYPEVMNPNNEAVKVPNQYADYISSTGYKKVIGIPHAQGGYFPTQGPGKALFKGYAEGGEDEKLPTYNYANKQGVIGGPRLTDKGTALPVGPDGLPIVNMPEFEIISTPTGYAPGEIIKERRDFRPGVLSNIPGLSSLASGNQPLSNRHEMYGPLGDLYRYYGGLPLKHDVLQFSEHKPTNAKDENAKYISLNNDQDFVNEVLDNYERVSSGKLNVGEESKLSDDSWAVSGYSSAGKNAHKTKKQGSEHHSNAVGHYTLGRGKDEKGEYISYYDTFDQGTGSRMNPGEMLNVTKPFEIYDRIYIDPKTGKPVESTQNNKKAAGGLTINNNQSMKNNNQSWKEYLKYAQGGYTNPYNQYQDDQYLQYAVGGKGIKNFAAGLYGAGEGILDTLTMGATDELTDKGFEALTKAGNKNIDLNNPDDVKFLKTQQKLKGYSNAAGAIGTAIATGNVQGAIKQGSKGLNTAFQATDGMSDEFKKWSQGVSGVAGVASGFAGGLNSQGYQDASKAGTGIAGFGQKVGKYSPLINQASGFIGGNNQPLWQQGQAQQELLNSPDQIAADRERNQSYTNQGLMYSQGGNMSNNSLNLRDTMRYKRFAQGGTFDQYGINMIPDSAGLHHESAYGGVPIGPDALAEGGEIKMDTGDGGQYIVSDQVDGAETQKDFTFSKGGKYKELNRTLADGMKQDLNRYTYGSLATSDRVKSELRRPNDSYSQSTIDQIKDKWQQKTEYARQRSQHDQAIAQAEEQKKMAEEQYVAAYGGRINPKKYPGLNYAKGGIHIKPENKGKFTASAKAAGQSVQEHATSVLNNPNATPLQKKRANFAKNAAGWKHANGGYVHNQMTQPMYAEGGPLYGDPASPYTYAYGGAYGDPYARGGQINYTNDMYAGGGPMPSNLPQAFDGPSAQNKNGMYLYPNGGPSVIPTGNPIYTPDSGIEQFAPDASWLDGGNQVAAPGNVVSWPSYPETYGDTEDPEGVSLNMPTNDPRNRNRNGFDFDINFRKLGRGFRDLTRGNFSIGRPTSKGPTQCETSFADGGSIYYDLGGILPPTGTPPPTTEFNFEQNPNYLVTQNRPVLATNTTAQPQPIPRPAAPPENSYVQRPYRKGHGTKYYNLTSSDPEERKKAFLANRANNAMIDIEKNKGIGAQNLLSTFDAVPVNRAEGGMMSPDQQMQQQAPQEQMQQQGGQDQMMQMVQQVEQMLQQGAQPEQVMQQLVQSGVPQEQAQQVVQMAMQDLQSQMQQQGQEQPMQEGQQMPPQQGMARGGMYPDGGMIPTQNGMANKIADDLRNGAEPNQVLQQLVGQGMSQEQAMAMVQAVMGQVSSEMQKQPQQQMAQQPMMAARGGYFNARKQYKKGGEKGGDDDWAPNQDEDEESTGNTFSPLSDESTMSKIAGLGQAVTPALASAFAFNKLSKRKIKPTAMEAVLQNRDAEINALRDEWQSQTAAGLRQQRNMGQTAGSVAGNTRDLILSSLKEGQKPIMDIYSQMSIANQQARQQANLTNKQAADDFAKENESMYQNAMQTGFEAAGQGVKNAASYYADLEDRNLQRWQAMNTSGEDWHWTPKGKAFRNKDGIYMINGIEVDPTTGNEI